MGEPVAPVAPERHDDGRERDRSRRREAPSTSKAQRHEGSAAATTRATVATATSTLLTRRCVRSVTKPRPQHPLALAAGPLERHEHEPQQRDTDKSTGAG